MEKEKFDTCKQATMIRGQLVVSKARCLKCELWEPKKTRRKKDADQKPE